MQRGPPSQDKVSQRTPRRITICELRDWIATPVLKADLDRRFTNCPEVRSLVLWHGRIAEWRFAMLYCSCRAAAKAVTVGLVCCCLFGATNAPAAAIGQVLTAPSTGTTVTPASGMVNYPVPPNMVTGAALDSPAQLPRAVHDPDRRWRIILHRRPRPVRSCSPVFHLFSRFCGVLEGTKTPSKSIAS